MPKRALLFINGDLPNRDAARKIIQDDDFIIAVDGGTRHALNLGLVPSVIIGDLDSVDLTGLDETKIIQYPADKDETDLELALEYAINAGYEQIRLIGALGGRLDQTLGNLSLLTDESYAGVDLRIDDGVEEAFFICDQAQIHVRIGDLVSLIPWGNPVTGICTEGLRWQLSNESLYPHKTRGISNEAIAALIHIQIEDGLLLIVHKRLRV
ncbi:MAG: thiamine diphosphokinase [Anaerolineae bacterium]|jgi:thiamine pyrophosphokinase|nr:thiamine diphosphokinase [Anaerolineae bacterium]MBT7073590.1 thiamine diphosphokinase [Anaerolineae bacterium]